MDTVDFIIRAVGLVFTVIGIMVLISVSIEISEKGEASKAKAELFQEALCGIVAGLFLLLAPFLGGWSLHPFVCDVGRPNGFLCLRQSIPKTAQPPQNAQGLA